MTTPKQLGRDLTSGSLHRNIWFLAIPMILETSVLNVTQLLDTYWIGKLGSAALAAVTISVTIRWVLNSLSNGLGIGGMAVIARRIGEKDEAAAEHAVWQTILLGASLSVFMAIVGIALARPLLQILGADATVLSLGLSYLRITLGGIFTLMLVFVINAMLRGAGEAKLAMKVLILTTVVTVILEPIMVFGWGPVPKMGIDGAAWSNVLGFGAGLALQLFVLFRGKARIRINLSDMKPDFPLIGKIIKIALPSTMQMVFRSSSRLIIVGLVGIYGTFATAGYGVANRMILIALIPAFGLANSASTLVGQNLGAKKPDRAEVSAWWVSIYGAIYLAVAGLLLFIFARPLISFFDPTPEVVAIGVQCLRIVAPSLMISAFGIALGRSFDGAGDTVPAMLVNLSTLWILEIPAAYGLAKWAGLGVIGIFWGRAIANVANGVAFGFWFKLGRWKRRKV
jgi:putative MATE family efflux protein